MRRLYNEFHAFSDVKASEEKLKGELEITGGLLSVADAVSGKTDIDKMMRTLRRGAGASCVRIYAFRTFGTGRIRPFALLIARDFSTEFVPVFKTEVLSPKTGFVEDAARGETVFHLPAMDRLDGSVFPFLPDIETLAVMPLTGRSGLLAS